jgi:predicted PurR-regulated permease PerM
MAFYRVATLVLAIGALYFAKAVLVPLALAILLTNLFVPAVTRLERLHLSRLASVLIVILCGLSVTCSLGWIVNQEFTDTVARWPEYRANIRDKCRGLIQWADRLEGYRSEIGETLRGESDSGSGELSGTPSHEAPIKHSTVTTSVGEAVQPPPVLVRLSPEPTSLLDSVALHVEELLTPFMTALMTVVILTFMLLNWEDLRDRALSLISDSMIQVTRDTFHEATKRVSRFLVTQSIINVCFGVTAAFGLWAIHATLGGRAAVSTAVAAGFLCGVLRFIPYFGVWIGAIFPLAFTFAAYPDNAAFLATLVMFLALEVFTAQIIEPRWLGASVGISATGIVLSTVFWTWLWGPIGLVLSTPLTVLLVVAGKHLPIFRYVYVLFADRREDRGRSPMN